MTHPLRLWLSAATDTEKQALADASCSGSVNMLHQYAGGHRLPSAEKAILIERAANKLTARARGRLPGVMRTDLSAACAGCEFAKKCMKNR